MGEKGENKEKYQRRTKKPARKSESSNLLLCCVLCALFGRKKEFSAGRGLCFVSCSFLLLVLVLVLFQGLHVQLGLRVCIYTRGEKLVFSIFIPPRPRTLQFVSGHPFSLA